MERKIAMTIKNKFELGQKVFLVTDPDQEERMVVEIHITPRGIIYILMRGDVESAHYDIEISETKQIL